MLYKLRRNVIFQNDGPNFLYLQISFEYKTSNFLFSKIPLPWTSIYYEKMLLDFVYDAAWIIAIWNEVITDVKRYGPTYIRSLMMCLFV